MSRICLLVILVLSLFIAGCGGYGSNNMGGGAGAPTITSLSPNMTNAGDPAFTLTVNGSGFGTDSVVYWNGAALPSSYLEARYLRFPFRNEKKIENEMLNEEKDDVLPLPEVTIKR